MGCASTSIYICFGDRVAGECSSGTLTGNRSVSVLHTSRAVQAMCFVYRNFSIAASHNEFDPLGGRFLGASPQKIQGPRWRHCCCGRFIGRAMCQFWSRFYCRCAGQRSIAANETYGSVGEQDDTLFRGKRGVCEIGIHWGSQLADKVWLLSHYFRIEIESNY